MRLLLHIDDEIITAFEIQVNAPERMAKDFNVENIRLELLGVDRAWQI